ncbi:MAG: LD-carboxypeptidase [Chloroflexi bacterium]|nr:LD-carboxypeptidase [Chloroflexota bacterium]
MSAPFVRPPRLRAGDLVTIVNPSRALPGDEPLAGLHGAIAGLEQAGLRVRIGPHVGARWTPPAADGEPAGVMLAGRDEERASDLNAAFADPAVRLVLAAWGGGGADRLLRAGLLDWPALRRDPKLLCGFSDFAHVALAAHTQADLVTIDGPSALQWAAGPAEPMLVQALAVMGVAAATGPLSTADPWYASQVPPQSLRGLPARPRMGGRRWLRPGHATGRLVVASPRMLLALVEAGLAPTLDGALWCLDSYRDRADHLADTLGRLQARDRLSGLAGIVVARPWPSSDTPAALDAAVLAATAALVPPPVVLADADTGHSWPKWSLPNGVPATLDSATDRFAIDGAAVA